MQGFEEQGTESGLTRRRLVALGAAAIPLAAGLGALARPTSAVAGYPAILKPLPTGWFYDYGTNAETRFESLSETGYLTPNERFFVRNHTQTPTIDAETWSLRVFGSGLKGNRETTFTLRQLQRLRSRKLTSFIECAGNGRSFFGTQQGQAASGTAWKLGAIGVAQWRGVPLSEVLEHAGLSRRAVAVQAAGLDAEVTSGGVNRGHVRRPLPIEKALDDVLLAYEMNGAPLPPDHGFPVRLVVPGWVGISNIKWVGEIEVSDQPLDSFWYSTQYLVDGVPLTTQTVKSAWEVGWNAAIPSGQRVSLNGRAWSGTSRIARVDVSIDQGATWTRARLGDRHDGGAWVQFSYSLPRVTPGAIELWSRATDKDGRTQPSVTPFNSNGYQFNAIVKHPVVIT